MSYLPLANIMHHKLGSLLSALGIGLGICMLITLTGLSRGSVNGIVDRWNTVDADLIAFPSSTDLTMAYGGAVSLKNIDLIGAIKDAAGQPLASHVTPVYLARQPISGRMNAVFGIRAEDFPVFQNQARLLPGGRLPGADGQFARWIAQRFDQAAKEQAAATQGAKADDALSISEQELREHGGLEMAIDVTLARQLHKNVGDTVDFAACQWKIVGIFEAHAVGRAVTPMATLQYVMNGGLDRVTMLFVKLRDPASQAAAAQTFQKATPLKVVLVAQYQVMLMENLGMMYTYVDMVNIVALFIVFLFTLVTLYTMVLQRTREIAILKSMGASKAFLLRQVLAESMLLTGGGVLLGVGLSFPARLAIEGARPDLRVEITLAWIGVALLAAVIGAVSAALYPAWHASRVDVADALTLE